MAEVRLGAVVSLAEATGMVEHTGEKVSFVFKGEMGIGKSAILQTLSERLGDAYRYVYAEAQTYDVGDVSGVPYTELINGTKVTRFAPNFIMGVHETKPVILMIDEIGKASRPVQNSFLRVLQSHKIGSDSMPPGSMVFGTTNLAVEGLSDHVQSHAQNRVSMVEVRKPTADEWLPWAMDNAVHPVVQAWVKKFPHCLASFKDGEGNPYVFYPSKTEGAFVSPRSLETASHIMWVRDKLGDNATAAGVRGSVGDAAATDMMTFAQTFDRLPSWEATISNPETCLVPAATDFAANFVTVFSGISLVDKKTFTPFMCYAKRLPVEYQAVFALQVLKSPKRGIALENRQFVVWATSHEWLM